MKKLFELHQKLTLVANEYAVLKDKDSDEQQLVAYVKQKRFALREKFNLFSDTSQTSVIASSQARSVMDLGAVFDVQDDSGKPLAALKKEFKQSLINSTWSVYDPELKTLLYTIREKNAFVAIFRRLWNFIPIAGEIPFFIKFHFTISKGGNPVGEYMKITSFRDHYALYMEESEAQTLDERVWMVMAVLLDAMQSR